MMAEILVRRTTADGQIVQSVRDIDNPTPAQEREDRELRLKNIKFQKKQARKQSAKSQRK